ncbi:SpoIIE family protein phosphatase [Paenibacillus xanthanilyticus]|uniref:SpoIIE family protein phosphatase n=1 Tax=Paenibacillus xanthanilyticus TaxID=1783531 RepID=A0ABV8K2J5_9BACL
MGILIVDDSPMMQHLFRDVLVREGYANVHTASSADEAFMFLGIHDEERPKKTTVQINLILLDIVMPGMDGIEACKIIKKHDTYKDTPIIFITASKSQIMDAFLAGGMDFIQKDFEQYELLARVKSALSLKREMNARIAREIKIRRELQLAKQVQKSVLSQPIVDGNIQIHGKYLESDEVSGDMFYWAQVSEDQYAILVLDVSGHGLSSALITMSVRSLLERTIRQEVEPERVFTELNEQMVQLFGGGKKLIYFTALYLLVDVKTKMIHYFNAGHPPGLVLSNDKVIDRLTTTTVPIGVKKNPPVKTGMLHYENQTRIILYTDGLVETPGVPVSVSINKLSDYVSLLRGQSNESFLEEVAVIKQNRSDDICIISILLS